jgi:5S rRNA maturation endonuclease (ribonuclease M5)
VLTMSRRRTLPVEKFEEAYKGRFPGNPITRSGGESSCKCPGHDGQDHDSMSFTEGDDGRLLTKCHSKDCSYERIMAAVGLEPKDGYPGPKGKTKTGKVSASRSPGRRPKKTKSSHGRSRPSGAGHEKNVPTTPGKKSVYVYRNEDGQSERVVLKTPRLDRNGVQVGKDIRQGRPIGRAIAWSTKGGWFELGGTNTYKQVAGPEEERPSKDALLFTDPVPHLLYRLPEVKDAIAQGNTIFVVEGEGDVETLRKHGICATTNEGGAGKWRKEHTEQLAGAKKVIIIPDNDDPGRKHANQVGKSLTDAGIDVKLLELPDLDEKGDVSDWLEAGGTEAELKELIKEAPPWSPMNGGQEEDSATFEILDRLPPRLKRPLSLIDDTGYLYTEVPVGE